MVKIGDRVRVTNQDGWSGDGTVYEVKPNGSDISIKKDSTGSNWHIESSNYTIINSINSMPKTLKEKFALVFKAEPERSFIKAGVMNTDESLTPDGETLLLAYLLKKFGDDFKKEVVDPILAADEASK